MNEKTKNYKNYVIALEMRKKRYKKRVLFMLKNDLSNTYFITLTFNNKTLNKTCFNTRLRYVKNFMKEEFKDYILNIDFGTKKNREHYHALGIKKFNIINFKAWNQHGYIKAQRTYKRANIEETINLSLDRFTDHAFKDTTKNSKIIYSRKTNKN